MKQLLKTLKVVLIMNNELMQYIDINPIVDKAKELNCPFIAIIGGKGTGKTYGCVDYALRDFFKKGSGRPFFYARRYDKTFTPSLCGNLINSHRQDIINLSKGKYNTADLRGKVFTVSRETISETGISKKTFQKPIAFCRSLNNVETETGDDKGSISCVIYDEFLTRGGELKDEYTKLMILHNNATRNRTDRFVPMFLLGNTVSRDSALAERFGIRMRDIKRGLNVFENRKHEARILLYYTPETAKNVEAAETYYNRFEDDRINMISRGDWILGTYNVAPYDMLFKRGLTAKFYFNNVAVNGTIFMQGITPCLLIKKPTSNVDILISPVCGKNNIQVIPKVFIECVKRGNLFVETPEIGEDFRDICKHIVNGSEIVNCID